MPEKVKTSIKMDPELWKQAKITAIQHDMDLGELVEESIRDWIRRKLREEEKGNVKQG